MIVRVVRGQDVVQMYERFLQAQVSRADASKKQSGFFEYNLKFNEFKERSLQGLSVVMELNRRISGYVIAYPIGFVKSRLGDPVFDRVAGFDERTVYADQLFVSPSLPLFVSGRVVDSWERLIRGEGFEQTVAVIPEAPWANKRSFGFVISRGFKPRGAVNMGDVRLRVVTKPYINVGDN